MEKTYNRLLSQIHKNNIHRHTSFFSTLLYCTVQILHFLQIECLWQSCIKQVHRHHFLVAFAYFMSLCPISIILTIFQMFSMLLFFYGNLWCHYYKFQGILLPCPYKMANLVNKCVCSDYFTDQPFPHLSPSPQASQFPKTQYWN